MGIDWNPSFPEQIGDQRQNVGYGSTDISSQGAWASLNFTALHSGPVEYMEAFGVGKTTQLGPEHFNQFRPMVLDLYPGDDVSYDVSLTEYTPSAVTGSSAMYNENLTQPITASRLVGSDSTFLACAAVNHYVRVQFNSGAFPLTRRVLGVRLLVQGNAATQVYRVDPGGASWVKTRTLGNGTAAYGNWIIFTGDARTDNATTPLWRCWTPQDIRDFASGGANHWFFRCKGSPGKWRLSTVRLQVIWTEETRVGVGAESPQVGYSWTYFPMRTPAATGTPSLVAGQRYTAVIRQAWNDSEFALGTASLSWRYLNGAPLVTGWDATNIPVGTVAVTGSSFGAPLVRYPATDDQPLHEQTRCFQTVTGAPSQDGGTVCETSMPYAMGRAVYVLNQQQVKEGTVLQHDISQYLQVSGAATSRLYGQSSAMVGWNPNRPPERTATLTAEVWTATGAPEVRVFSPVTRTFADLSRLPVDNDVVSTGEINSTFRRVRFRHPETRTLPAGLYEVRFTANGLINNTAFFLEGQIALNHVVDQTYGRSTEFAEGLWPSGLKEYPLTGSTPGVGSWTSDVLVTLMTVPPPVTGLAAAVGVTTAHHAEVCAGTSCANPGCADTASPFATLTWSQTDDPESDTYEVQRSDIIDSVFRTVGFVRGVTNTTWPDHEGRIGVTSFYRIRSVRPDGIAGDWSDSVSVTLPAGQIALTFTSNAATGLAVVYPESFQSNVVNLEYEFGEYEDVDFERIYNRERQIAFHPIERKGVRFERQILLNALCTVALPTLQIYTPLRRLSWAPIPYVCIRDGEGNRWFANVMVPNARVQRPGELWFANVIVTEVADVPAVVDTDVEQVSVESLGDVVI